MSGLEIYSVVIDLLEVIMIGLLVYYVFRRK